MVLNLFEVLVSCQVNYPATAIYIVQMFTVYQCKLQELRIYKDRRCHRNQNFNLKIQLEDLMNSAGSYSTIFSQPDSH